MPPELICVSQHATISSVTRQEMVAEIERLRRENALLQERNRLRDENAVLKARGCLSVCPNCGAQVCAGRLQAHVTTRCPAVTGSSRGSNSQNPRHKRTKTLSQSQYTDEEYKGHVGWGHSSLSSAVLLALDANVKRVLLFHHDPSHDDDMIDRMVEQARELVRKSGKAMVIEGAREGAEILLELPEPRQLR